MIMRLICEFKIDDNEKIILKSEKAFQEIIFCDDIQISIVAVKEFGLFYD